MALKYYAAENARHADALHIHWTFAQCKSATDALCDHFGLPRIPVKLTKVKPQEEQDEARHKYYEDAKKRRLAALARGERIRPIRAWKPEPQKSFYNTNRRDVTFVETMLSPLTVAHEFAHYADHADRVAKNISFAIKWHGVRHLIRTNQAVDFVKTLPYYAPAKVTRLEGIKEWKSDTKSPGSLIIDTAYALLPEYCHCPKCGLNKPKKDFGMRVMARGEGGIPVKVSRQSYCRACRTHHKE